MSSDFVVLYFFYKHPDSHGKRLVETGYSVSQTYIILQRLEAAGLIRRQRRGSQSETVFTPKGVAVAEALDMIRTALFGRELNNERHNLSAHQH